jgi:starch synthase
MNASRCGDTRPTGAGCPWRVAILPWGNLIEDFLDPLGVSLDDFARNMSGGWLFGYAAALRTAGMEPVILCVSGRVHRAERLVNPQTGLVTLALPPSALYRRLRRFPGDPDAGATPRGRIGRRLQAAVPYLATPLAALRAVLRSEGITHLLCQEYEYERFDVMARVARRAGVPVFATFQGGVPRGGWLASRVRAQSLALADGLIVASGPEAARLASSGMLDSARIARIPNPIDTAEWHAQPRAAARAALGLPEGALVAVCHGRIDYSRKGLDLLVAAWRGLTGRHPGRDLRLHLIGGGRDEDRLQSEIDRAPVPGLRWLRRYSQDRDEMRRELSAADLYVMASRHEGFPVAPLEAMACGLPVILSDAPGAREILGLQPGTDPGPAAPGLLVPVGDAAALEQALDTLVATPDRLPLIGAAARLRVETAFSVDSVGAALARLLRGGAGTA